MIDGVCPKCTQAALNPAPQKARKTDQSNKFKSFFMNPKEKLVCTLGNTYIQNFLAGGGVSKGFSVVSDKRVYFRGTTYFVKGKRIKKMAESKVVDVKDVTGTSVATYSPTWRLILGIIISIVIFVFLIPMMSITIKGSALVTLLYLLISIMPLALGIAGYISRRVTLLKIEYAGGCIGFNIRWFPMEESTYYQKQLRIAKDKAIEEAESATANAVTAAFSQMVQPVAQPAAVAAAPASSADELIKYADLLEKGLITREEFDEFKAGILRR